jgi:hypothetical protein
MPPPDDQLEALAQARFATPPLTEAEIKLLRFARKGELAFCGTSSDPNHPQYDPNRGEEWGPARQIRADLIRWICTDRVAKELVDPKGVQMYGAKVPNTLDFFHVTLPFPLVLAHCWLMAELNLRDADVPGLNLQGSRVHCIGADGVTVRGNLFLRYGFQAEGEVRLLRARIGGDLDCTNAKFTNRIDGGRPEHGKALSADGAVVGGTVYLEHGFQAIGHVSFRGARIAGQLTCGGGIFENPAQEGSAPGGVALDASIASVDGGVFLWDKFRANGEVRLDAAHIGAVLECGDGIFNNPVRAGIKGTGYALSAERATVSGSINLRAGFRAEGEVRLLGAQIGGDFDCSGGAFKNPPSSNHALSAHNVTVKGNTLMRDRFQAEGEVSLSGAQLAGSLECTGGEFRGDFNLEAASVKGALLWRDIVNPKLAKLDLINASVGALADNKESWPAHGNLNIDGFSYERISGGPTGAKARLDWLARQSDFKPRPYRQLAQVLKDDGDDRGARQVLFEMERLRRRKEDRNFLSRFWSVLLRVTIGYGYRPARSLYGLLLLFGLGLALFYVGYSAGNMAPTDKDAYQEFRLHNNLPPYYAHFHATMYSIENCFPGVKLGQADHWQPDPKPRTQATDGEGTLVRLALFATSATTLDWFRSIQILFGPFFASMFALGLSGIIRKD